MSLLELGSRPHDWQDPASDLMRIFDHSELESFFRWQALDNRNIFILIVFFLTISKYASFSKAASSSSSAFLSVTSILERPVAMAFAISPSVGVEGLTRGFSLSLSLSPLLVRHVNF